MSYILGNTITAADFNSYVNTLNNLWATGNADRGYGQTVVVTTKSAGQTVAAADWLTLRNMISVMAAQQGTTVTVLPPTTPFQAGSTVIAHDQAAPSNNAYSLFGYNAAIDTNRLTAASGGMTLTTGLVTSTRATTWGGGTGGITATVRATFASEDAARYFFNSGGQVRLRMSQPNNTSQDADWLSILGTKVGTVILAAQSFAILGTGTAGVTSASRGFYSLTTTPQTVYSSSSLGTGAYSTNFIGITAAVGGVVGTNGGNGTYVQFVITLTDNHTGPTDSVSSGTVVTVDAYCATANLVGISNPTASVVTGF